MEPSNDLVGVLSIPFMHLLGKFNSFEGGSAACYECIHGDGRWVGAKKVFRGVYAMNAMVALGLVFALVSVVSLFLISFIFRDYGSLQIGYRIYQLSFVELLLALSAMTLGALAPPAAVLWIALALLGVVLLLLILGWFLVIQDALKG